MKVLFLHIGDIHTKDHKAVNFFQIKKIADALNSFSNFNRVILVIAGDVAQSGSRAQYKYAGYIVGNLIKYIRKKCKYKNTVDVICVPGNHDICHGDKPITSKELQDIRNNALYEKELFNQLQKQKDFFDFAKRNGCWTNKDVYCRKLIKYEGFTIEANLINSGIFSCLEEDKGLHYISQNDLNELTTPSGADFVITVMHHAPEWYTDDIKNRLEEAVCSKSSLVFYGHEHYLGKKRVAIESAPPATIQTGGCLCKNDNWSESAFHVGVLDTETREYKHVEYKWNSRQNQYEPKETMCDMLVPKPSKEKELEMVEEFRNDLLTDNKHDISADFREYYVFPRIQSEERIGNSKNEFVDEDSFMEEILGKKKVIITGGYNSGKTTLLKKLCLRFNDAKCVALFCNPDNLKNKKPEKIIRSCFEDMYGDNPSDFIRFEQLPKEQKVLIIDDMDQVKTKSLEAFLYQIGDRFEYQIFASSQLIDLSLFERIKAQLKATDSVYKFQIMPMYLDKRHALIERIVAKKIADPTAINKTIKILSDAITTQRRFISLDPDFIIKYVECYCNNIGDANSGDSGIFSKVFESSIVNAIGTIELPRLSVEKVFVLLSKVAHYIHFNKVYPISESKIVDIIDEYNIDYGDSVRSIEFIRIVTKGKILIFDELTGGYRFLSKSYLAYFVAREVNSQYNDTGDDTDLQTILHFACFGINSDILLFISFITQNNRILRYILQTAEEYTESWSEFDFNENMPKFLKTKRNHIVELPKVNAKEEEREANLIAEKESDETVQTVELYDYSEEDADTFVNQIVRAAQLMIIVSRCLPNFEHSMQKKDKDAFIEAIYTLPNKIFNLWASEADKTIDGIIEFFKEQSQDYYVRQKKLTEDDIIEVVQWTAMSFLLELYNLAAFYATKENTIAYLSGFNYLQKDTYELEHLMMLERQDSPAEFIAAASAAIKDKKDHLYPTLIRRVVGHALVFKSDMDQGQIQQLQTKFFPDKTARKQLLVQRTQNVVKRENE